jgi:hypothetical protein
MALLNYCFNIFTQNRTNPNKDSYKWNILPLVVEWRMLPTVFAHQENYGCCRSHHWLQEPQWQETVKKQIIIST